MMFRQIMHLLKRLCTGDSTRAHLLWAALCVPLCAFALSRAISILGLLGSSVRARWDAMGLPFGIASLHSFWLTMVGVYVLVVAFLWSTTFVRTASVRGRRVCIVLVSVAFLIVERPFRMWVISVDEALSSFEVILEVSEADLSVFGILHDIAPNCAVLARGGEQRVWVPPSIEDRRARAVARLREHGYRVRNP